MIHFYGSNNITTHACRALVVYNTNYRIPKVKLQGCKNNHNNQKRYIICF